MAIRLTITLLLINLISSLIGAALAAYAGFGLIACVLIYVASGMIGITGFVLFMAAHCMLKTTPEQLQTLPQLNR